MKLFQVELTNQLSSIRSTETATHISTDDWSVLQRPRQRPNKRARKRSPPPPQTTHHTQHTHHYKMTEEQVNTAANATNEAVNNAAPAANEAPKKDFWEELKRKLFPKARGRDKPAEAADGAAAPAAAAAESGEAAPAAAAPAAEGDAAAAAAAEPAAEKKSLIDKIKEVFTGKKKDGAAAPAAAAADGAPVAEAPKEGEAATAEAAQAAESQADKVDEAAKEVVKDLPAEERPVSVFIEKGEQAALKE